MSAAFRPRAVTAALAAEAWWAWSEHGTYVDAARAVGVTAQALLCRVKAYRRLHGLPTTAKPWDPSGALDLRCRKHRPQQARATLDLLLTLLERAETNGEGDLATHLRHRLHFLERRIYGWGCSA